MKSTFPVKPDILYAYEAVKGSNIPLVAGGLVDQPYIWSLQYEEINEEVKLQELIKAHNETMRNNKK